MTWQAIRVEWCFKLDPVQDAIAIALTLALHFDSSKMTAS